MIVDRAEVALESVNEHLLKAINSARELEEHLRSGTTEVVLNAKVGPSVKYFVQTGHFFPDLGESDEQADYLPQTSLFFERQSKSRPDFPEYIGLDYASDDLQKLTTMELGWAAGENNGIKLIQLDLSDPKELILEQEAESGLLFYGPNYFSQPETRSTTQLASMNFCFEDHRLKGWVTQLGFTSKGLMDATYRNGVLESMVGELVYEEGRKRKFKAGNRYYRMQPTVSPTSYLQRLVNIRDLLT